MEKARTINWRETNMALVGSDLDKKIREAAAKGEPQWKKVGEKVELRVWRIEKFKVCEWPARQYGHFHVGDAYIVLKSFLATPLAKKLSYDVSIWIGDEATADEYGTAAYKMVELDDLLQGAPIQFREVQGHESPRFTETFGTLRYLSGGVESGFNHVEPSIAAPHLYMVKGTSQGMSLTQVKVRRDAMNSGDVFVLDCGSSSVFVWNGKEANKDEKYRGLQVANAFTSSAASAGTKVTVLDEGVNDGEGAGENFATEFWTHLPSSVSTMLPFIKKSLAVAGASNNNDAKVKVFTPTLYRVTSSGGFKKLGSTDKQFQRNMLTPEHAYLLDDGFQIFVWTGTQTPTKEKVAALHAATVYVKQHNRPALPTTMLKENRGSSSKFDARFTGDASAPSAKKGCCVIA